MNTAGLLPDGQTSSRPKQLAQLRCDRAQRQRSRATQH